MAETPVPPEAPSPRRRLASSYSRFVRLARLILPALGLAVVVSVVVWSTVRKNIDGQFALTFSSALDLVTGRQQMLNARYYGTNEQNEPYVVTFDKAEETSPGSGYIKLDKPKADLSRKDGSWVSLQAGSGVWSQTGGGLDLSETVDIYQDGGYELHTPTAQVDTKKGTAVGHDPVNGQGPLGIITGQGFKMDQTTGRVLVTGRSRMIIDQESIPSPSNSSASPTQQEPPR